MDNTDNRVRFTLRLPVDLHQKIKELADKNKRTVTREIEFILEHEAQNSAKGQKQ